MSKVVDPHNRKGSGRRILLPIIGFISLLWFLIRVIPKPSRAAYPCQRTAFPLATSFILWISGILGGAAIMQYLVKLLMRWRLLILSLALTSVSVVGCFNSGRTLSPVNSGPIGAPRGINPGRVVWVHDPDTATWNGTDGHYWDSSSVDQDRLEAMISSSLRSLSSTSTDSEAWDALFNYHNRDSGRGARGYSPGETIAVKINQNNQDNSYAMENVSIDAQPQTVLAFLRQLVTHAGVREEDIIVYDAVRPISDPILELCSEEFPDVLFYGGDGFPNTLNTDFPWTEPVVHYSGGNISAQDAGRIPVFLAESDYLVNLAILKTHGAITGVTLCGKNHFGSIGSPMDLHGSARSRDGEDYAVQVDLMGHEEIGGKTVLYIIDGLYGAVGSRGYAAEPSRWKSEPFSDHWPSSVLLSQDPVAIDSVGIDLLSLESNLQEYTDTYLHEAALAARPPSGTVYDPEGDGKKLKSLGVHEHWNNPREKQYSRNLNNRAKGIELIRI